MGSGILFTIVTVSDQKHDTCVKVISHYYLNSSNWHPLPAYSSTTSAVLVSYAEELGRNEGKWEDGGKGR